MTSKYGQIILHVGMHKTGTTSIQNNAHRLRETLLEHDIYYPSFVYKDIFKVNHSGPITALVCESPDRYGEQWRTGLGNDIESLQKTYRTHFSELLENPKASTLVLSGETTSAFEIEHLEALRDILTEHTDKLRVFVYIRDPHNAVASTLQQRVRGGSDRNRSRHIQNLAGVSRRRYTRLAEVFPNSIEVLNFHDEIAHQAGLVGSFLIRCGLPAELAGDLEFSSANPRMSVEAYKIMSAINKRYPATPTNPNNPRTPNGRARQYNDLRSLSYLPGQPFQLQHFDDEKIREAIRNESHWLESELDLHFPTHPETTLGSLWDDRVLFALEDAIRNLEHREHQVAAADFLESESRELETSQPRVSAVLAFIAHRIQENENDPLPVIVKRLGADYFKNGALQAESYSTELAMELMSIAKQLRPEGGTIQDSIERYRKKLAK
ncbi:MAG: hypothetical protein AB8B81_03335 [Halioglobus sp.]